jgi:hypothetical protein
VNASLASIQAGLKPIRADHDDAGKQYFLFRNGQVRRQIGQGHSRTERAARRQFRAGRRAAFLASLS